MPIERATWVTVPFVALKERAFDLLNTRLGRLFDLVDTNSRVQTLVANATATLALTWVKTLVESDTTAGNVTLTFPAAATVPGFHVTVVKTAGGNTLTANSVTVSTFAAWASTGATWRRVG